MNSKLDEIEIFSKFVAKQPPGSYLRSILDNIRGAVCEAIRNDFGFIDWVEMAKQQVEHRTWQDKAKIDKQALEVEKANLEREINQLQTAVNDLKYSARKLANLVA